VYWELISNPDPHQGEDYEVLPGYPFPLLSRADPVAMIQIQVNGADWGTISAASQSAAALTGAPFDFSASLAL
jgi:mannan endo-1,4-beta-mannosidase